MKTLHTLIVMLVFAYFVNAQNHHELSLGFAGSRVWELDPPEFIIQDLDYYFGPHIGYQYHFYDDKLVLGAQVGWMHETHNIESLTESGSTDFREVRRKTLMLDLEFGVNLIQSARGFLQVTSGLRANGAYYFSDKLSRLDEPNINLYDYDFNQWLGLRYDFTSSVSYQVNLTKQPKLRGQSLALKFSAEFVYFFPRELTFGSIENNMAWITGGFSASLIWRIRGKKNRGLF